MRLAIVTLLVATLAAAPVPDAPAIAVPGSAVPSFHATRLDGTPVNGAPAGKIAVLNFWATWCPPCRAETADLITAYRKLHAPDVVFLGIDTTETAPIVKTFLSAKGVPYPTALAKPDVYGAFDIIGIPTTVVVDANGVVRARWVGGVTPAQLAQYVAGARAGRTTTFVSPAQAKIDLMLSPDAYDFGDAAKRDTAVSAMNAAIAKAEALADDDDAKVDYERTERAEGALRVAAGTAIRDDATTDAQRIAGLTLIAKGEGNLGRWSDAVDSYRAAVALAPSDAKLVAALGRALYRLHDYAGMIAQARRYVELEPADGDGWSDLGLAYQRTGDFRDAVVPYEKSLALLRGDAAKTPTQDAIADVADTSLDLADVYVSLGDAAGARRTFAQANAYGDRLAAKGEYARLKRNVKERTQEGLVAVALANGGTGAPVLSIAPWSGPDLPGSVASTIKYRVIVAARANTPVTLRATGLRPAWVASFCTDGLCSPQTVSFASPPAGVKTYEFQLIPPQTGARPGNVAIAVAGGASVPLPR